jgi:hypothetical protein
MVRDLHFGAVHFDAVHSDNERGPAESTRPGKNLNAPALRAPWRRIAGWSGNPKAVELVHSEMLANRHHAGDVHAEAAAASSKIGSNLDEPESEESTSAYNFK